MSLLSIGHLIDRSWEFYRAQFRVYMQVSGWLIVIAILNVVALVLYPTAGAISYHDHLTRTETIGVVLYALTNFILSPLLGFFLFLMLAQTASKLTRGESVDVAAIMRTSKKIYLSTAVVVLLIGLMLLFAQIITLGPSILIGILGAMLPNATLLAVANLLFMAGLFLSAILTTRWAVSYLMAPYANILDGAQKKSALTQSESMIRGKFWAVFFRFLLPKFVFLLFGLFLGTILSILIQVLINGSAGLNLDAALRLTNLTEAVIPILVTILINPLFIVSDVLLYTSLKGEPAV